MKEYNPLILKKDNYLPHQWSFLTKKGKPNARISALIGGLGCGKSKALISKSAMCLVNKVSPATGKSNGLILYPTYSLSEEVFVQPFIELLEKCRIPYDYNIASHKFKTLFGDIKIYVTNQANKIVGSNYTWAGVDELDIESFKNADTAISKALGRLRGCEDAELFITSTPEGYSFCWDFLVNKASDDKLVIHGKSTDNPYLPKSYIQSLRDNYDDNLLKAYLLGQFTNLQKGSTYVFDRDRDIRECKYDRTKPIYVGMDFNNDPMAACIIQEEPNGPQIRVIDELMLSHQGSGDLLTDRMCQTIRERYPNNQYHIFPDATGASKHSSSRFSDIELIRRQQGFRVHVRHINPLVINRVNSVNNNLNKGNVIIDPKCKALIRDLEQVVNKEGTREIDKKGMSADLSHVSDAFGYYCNFRHPSVKPVIGTQDR